MQQMETNIDNLGKNEDDHDETLIKCLEKTQKIGITMKVKKLPISTNRIGEPWT